MRVWSFWLFIYENQLQTATMSLVFCMICIFRAVVAWPIFLELLILRNARAAMASESHVCANYLFSLLTIADERYACKEAMTIRFS